MVWMIEVLDWLRTGRVCDVCDMRRVWDLGRLSHLSTIDN